MMERVRAGKQANEFSGAWQRSRFLQIVIEKQNCNSSLSCSSSSYRARVCDAIVPVPSSNDSCGGQLMRCKLRQTPSVAKASPALHPSSLQSLFLADESRRRNVRSTEKELSMRAERSHGGNETLYLNFTEKF